MAITKKKWLSNSLLNVVGGGGTALVNVLVPAILARKLAPTDFAIWSLVLQIVPHLNFFTFGIQNAVAKYIAERPSLEGRAEVLNAGFRVIFGGMALSAVATGFVVLGYPLIFSDMNAADLPTFRLALLYVGLSVTFQLLAQVPSGLFLGLQANHFFVLPQLAGKVLSVLAIWAVAAFTSNLSVLALAFALGSALVVPILFGIFRRSGWRFGQLATLAPNSSIKANILRYCSGLSVWTFSMLLVSALGPVIVGSYNLLEVPSYAIATTAMAVVAGLSSAILSPLLPAVSVAATQESTRSVLPTLLVTSTTWVVVFFHLIFIFLLVAGERLLALWVGNQYVGQTYQLMIALAAANTLRNAAMPYAVMLMGTALHRQTIASALIEGFCNLAASLVLVRYYGALGVAYGCVVGAAAGLAIHLFHNFRRTPELTPKPARLIMRGMILPTVSLSPFVLLYFWLK